MKYILYGAIAVFSTIVLGTIPYIVVPWPDAALVRHLAILGVMEAVSMIAYLSLMLYAILEEEKQ